jgi:hypothetical protein
MLHHSPDWQKAFLAKLVKRLSVEPSTALNSRCLSEQTLYGVLDELEGQDFRLQHPKSRIIAWLQETGLLAVIPVTQAKPGTRTTRFYSLDIAQSPSSHVSPLELLQACQSDGVICYFTAVAFHSLSTQQPVHHHVAIPIIPAIPTESDAKPTAPKVTRRQPARPRNPLGTHLFNYDGVPFYKTSREKRLLPGVQSRYIGPTTVIRITNLEQTLVDALHRPLHCGGPAVVFEAWGQGLKRMNEDRLADYLTSMDYRPIAQRLGYVLDDLDYKPRPKLRSVLDQYLSQLDPADSAMHQQLFPGIEYHNLRLPWLVYGP